MVRAILDQCGITPRASSVLHVLGYGFALGLSPKMPNMCHVQWQGKQHLADTVSADTV